MNSHAALRGWWASRQGLSPGSAPKSIEASIKQAGGFSTSGAPTAYLSIRARKPNASRDAIDRVAMDGVHAIEVPGLAGRPHLLVPPADAPTLLAFHTLNFQTQLASSLARDGVSESALRSVSAAVVAALEECPLSTSGIREVVTHRDASVLLRIALTDLMLRGVVRRFPSNGRIDSTDYQFELRHPDDRPVIESDAEAVTAKAVERFLKHQGPVTLDEICAWGDLSKGRARKALDSIRAEAVSVAGWADESWLCATDIAKWKSFKPEAHDRVAFLPYRDPFVLNRRTPKLLTTAAGVQVLDNRYAKLIPLSISAAAEIDHHTIACGNGLVGVWEYDPKAKAVVTSLWHPTTRLRRLVADAAEETTAFIRDELGDAKLSAVDPPEKRAQRLAFCRTS